MNDAPGDQHRAAIRWSELPSEVAALAGSVRSRLEAHPHHVLATLHRDGRPRVSGTNVMFDRAMMWIGTMPRSRKGVDLGIDPRCAIHSAPLDEQLGEGAGDARVEAVAHQLPPDVSAALLRDAFGDDATMDGDLWELWVTSMSMVTVERDRMRIRAWSPATGMSEVLRD